MTDDEKAPLWAYEELARRMGASVGYSTEARCSGNPYVHLAASLIAKHEQPPEPKNDWFAGEVDCDGNELTTIRTDELQRIREALARKDARARAAERERWAAERADYREALNAIAHHGYSCSHNRDIAAAAIRNGGTDD